MLFICINISLSGQSDTKHAVSTDSKTESVDVRVPSKDKIQKYQEDERFQYGQAKDGIPWYTKLKYIILEFINKLLSGVAESGIPSVIIVLVFILIVIFIILKLMGVKFRTLIGKKKMDIPEIDIYTENVHEMNFDTLILSALNNKDYRLAVRFLYLKNLKLLSDKGIIKWNVNKTNYSYQNEIKSTTLRSKFIDTTFIFDYVWYGEFALDENKFSEIDARMNHFNKMVTDER